PDLKAPDPKAFEGSPEELQKAQTEYAKSKADYDQRKADYDKLKVDTEKELREYFKPKPGESVGRFISPYWKIDLAVRRAERKEDELAALGGGPGGPGGIPGGGGLRGGGGPPGGGVPLPGGPDAADRGGPGGALNNLNFTPNGLPRLRYVHMTEQVRRMPIG